MLDVIGQVLSQAVAVAVSPMPLVALLVLMIAGNRAMAWVWAFGWLLAVFAGISVGALLGGSSAGMAATGDSGHRGINWTAFVFAALFFWLAWRNLSHRPHKGEPVETPRWVEGLEKMTWYAALGLVMLLMLVNAKNTAIYLSMGATVASAQLGFTDAVITILIITVISSLTAIIVVLLPAILGKRADHVLAEMNTWLMRNNSLILGILFLILGASQLGHALQTI